MLTKKNRSLKSLKTQKTHQSNRYFRGKKKQSKIKQKKGSLGAELKMFKGGRETRGAEGRSIEFGHCPASRSMQFAKEMQGSKQKSGRTTTKKTCTKEGMKS